MGVGVRVVLVFFVFFLVVVSTTPSVSGWRWCCVVVFVVPPVFFLWSVLGGCLGGEDHPPLGDDVPGRREGGDDNDRGGAPMHEPACIGARRIAEDMTCAWNCLDDELDWWWWRRRGQRWGSFLEGRGADSDQCREGGGENWEDDGVGEIPQWRVRRDALMRQHGR